MSNKGADGGQDARIAELERENASWKEAHDFQYMQATKALDYAIELQRLLESLKREDTPSPHLHHHQMVIDTKAKIASISAALKVAREEVEKAPHDATPGRYGDPECGLLKDLSRVGNGPCDCWKREALAAIDAATTGLPLPLAGPPQTT